MFVTALSRKKKMHLIFFFLSFSFCGGLELNCYKVCVIIHSSGLLITIVKALGNLSGR